MFIGRSHGFILIEDRFSRLAESHLQITNLKVCSLYCSIPHYNQQCISIPKPYPSWILTRIIQDLNILAKLVNTCFY